MQKCIWLCGNRCSENHGSGNIILSKLSNSTPKCLLPQYFLPPLPPLPHHPMHFRTHRCNNCGDKFHSLVQRSCSKRSWRSSAHWSSEMGTSYGKLTVVVNQKQWLKRRQPQRAATDPRAPRRRAVACHHRHYCCLVWIYTAARRTSAARHACASFSKVDRLLWSGLFIEAFFYFL